MGLALRIVVIIFIGIFLVVGIPIFINEIYNIGWYVTHWGATDVLGFYGSVLGGFATLIAIYITIIRENKIRREENVKQEKERNRQMAIQREADFFLV